MFAGTLPASWGGTAAFPLLLALQLLEMPLSGKMPSSWGSKGSMPSLTTLLLGADNAGVSLLSGASTDDTLDLHKHVHLTPQTTRGFCNFHWQMLV